MPVRIQCPHCDSPCLVQEQHLGRAVCCGRCGQLFSVRPADGPAPRPVGSGDEVSVDFGPGIASLLEARAAKKPAPAPPSAPAAWSPPAPLLVHRLDVGGATSVGMVREHNEDSFLIHQLTWSNLDQRRDAALLVVADGVGGHNAGDRASRMTIHTLGQRLSVVLAGLLSGHVKEPQPVMLLQALRAANQAVRRAQSEPGCRGMAATAAVVLVWDGRVLISHVGDARVYGAKGGRLRQLTQDQTVVARMVGLGQLTPAEAEFHPARNEIAQAVGSHPEIEPSASSWQLAPGDWLIVACDGLHAHVDAAQLETALRTPIPSGSFMAHHLVEMANEGGGSDNCTVIAVRCY